MRDNILNAILSIWSNKIRSVLTVLGVVIGVTSVTTLVSLGEGMKRDIASSIQGFGTNVITIVSGKIDTSGSSNATNPANFISGDILTTEDVDAIATIPGIESVAPISLIPGTVKFGDKAATPALYGTYPTFLEAVAILPIEAGRFIETKDEKREIVLGRLTAETLFGEAKPIGKEVTIGNEAFTVVGVFGKAKTAGIISSEFDSISAIPFDMATKLNKGNIQIMRILAKASDTADVGVAKQAIETKLLDNHNGEQDFTVLTQDDILDLFNTFLNLATTLVSAIAAISLIVGGIGIMNIMLVTVTERTREIGLRKAVGATKQAILIQFLTESIMVTFVGALIGLLISLVLGFAIATKSELTPYITPHVILLSVGISIAVGIIFGLWPALRAANKDPIEALRYE